MSYEHIDRQDEPWKVVRKLIELKSRKSILDHPEYSRAFEEVKKSLDELEKIKGMLNFDIDEVTAEWFPGQSSDVLLLLTAYLEALTIVGQVGGGIPRKETFEEMAGKVSEEFGFEPGKKIGDETIVEAWLNFQANLGDKPQLEF